MKKAIFILLLLNFSISLAEIFETKEDQGKVEFLAQGPLVKVKGKGTGVSGKIDIDKGMKASGEFQFDLNSLETGIKMRDDHMKNNYLHVKDNPKATISFKDLIIPKSFKGKLDFIGVLELNAVKKPIHGSVVLKGKKNEKVAFNADLKLRFSDFEIPVPSFKLVSVGEEMTIKIISQAALNRSSVSVD